VWRSRFSWKALTTAVVVTVLVEEKISLRLAVQSGSVRNREMSVVRLRFTRVWCTTLVYRFQVSELVQREIRNDQEIYDALSRYLNGGTTLQEFEDRFMPVLWDLGSEEESDARKFAGTVANLIAAYSDGVLTEPSLRRELGNARNHALEASRR
jgi:hypothetical protein